LKEGKPMVDAQGKPYENRTNPIREDEEEEDYDEGMVNALGYYGISSIRRHHLN